MNYHITLSRSIDFATIAQEAAAGQSPRHAMGLLRDKLSAIVHHPTHEVIRLSDKLWAKIAGTPQSWALARRLAHTLTSEDVVFCTGEDIGIPMAACCGAYSNRPKIAVFIHNLDRPRGFLSAKLFALAHRVDLFITNAPAQAHYLHSRLGIPISKIFLLTEHIDTQFFVPGQSDCQTAKPILASVGLENRDYRTIAQATQDLPVEVRISGFSRDAKALARAFPKVMPANMSRQFYPWTELRQLYWNADLVIVSLVENKFCAGLTAILEAIVCGKPLIVTRTHGLSGYLEQIAPVCVVDPGDVVGMQQAIVRVLSNLDHEQELAQQRRIKLLQRHTMEQYIETLATQLTSLAPGSSLPQGRRLNVMM
ncbi:glycosyltransferase family 4 protein [Alkalinema pantanalense CENA528]|uniref:glycosyltransferase family 4 protein n=1 Tax=Alkalinema pantanalense TaxID=1620705 RepID=UPI003D700DC5